MEITAWAQEHFQKSVSVNKTPHQNDPDMLPSSPGLSSFEIDWGKVENCSVVKLIKYKIIFKKHGWPMFQQDNAELQAASITIAWLRGLLSFQMFTDFCQKKKGRYTVVNMDLSQFLKKNCCWHQIQDEQTFILKYSNFLLSAFELFSLLIMNKRYWFLRSERYKETVYWIQK